MAPFFDENKQKKEKAVMLGKNDTTRKKQMSNLFLIAVFLLLTLPLLSASQDNITKLLALTGISKLTQEYIIPIETKCVLVLLHMFGIGAKGDTSTIILGGNTEGSYKAQIIWSCIGWQSVVLLIFTLVTGLRGKFTFSSKIETIIIGLFGTFWINIFRITLIYLIGYYFGQRVTNILHNSLGTILVLIWLFFYWWFSYTYVLENKNSNL